MPSPLGAVVAQDGPLVRVHYGTHGQVDHRDTAGVDLTRLVLRQKEEFARRVEPVEWRVHAHDSPGLAEALTGAGFTPGWERSVLVAPVEDIPEAVPPPGFRLIEAGIHPSTRALEIADASGPHRTPLPEARVDGFDHAARTLHLLDEGSPDRLRAVGWASVLTGTPFVTVGGMSEPHPAFPSLWARRLGPSWPRWWDWFSSGARFMLAEADGPLRDVLRRSGFHEITTVRSYHWVPPGTPATTRPVQMLLSDPEHDDLWDRFDERFSFAPSVERYPGIVEPPDSATWFLDGPDEAIEDTVLRGLLDSVLPGEPLYWLDWNHQGYRFDPARVEGPGLPRAPGQVLPDGDYYIYATRDLRLGTFGHPWEGSLCVFGRDLLARVEDALTQALGEPRRRGGREVGHA
ncbi:DUF2716 domain-containing protein [Nocardiopsis tropica]|uniref:DUF2716 domain-containing protein n=1 Tax=Nocardiopsis tropica TaxID=109330 RepID=A0ABV1ZNZ4_9ACTN